VCWLLNNLHEARLNIVFFKFSLYHFYGLMANTTTIEGWEKDKAATMVRRGQVREVCAVS